MTERPGDSASKRRCFLFKKLNPTAKYTPTKLRNMPWSTRSSARERRGSAAGLQQLGDSVSAIWMLNQMMHIDIILTFEYFCTPNYQFVYCRYDLMTTATQHKLLKRSYSSHSQESEPFQICFEIRGFLLSHLQKGQSGPIHCYFSCMVLGNDPWTRHGAKEFNAFW